jgi:hypothetical protein
MKSNLANRDPHGSKQNMSIVTHQQVGSVPPKQEALPVQKLILIGKIGICSQN